MCLQSSLAKTDRLVDSFIRCAGTEGAIRLADVRKDASINSTSGVLEIFHAGAWGTFCDGDFGTGYSYVRDYGIDPVRSIADPSALSS